MQIDVYHTMILVKKKVFTYWQRQRLELGHYVGPISLCGRKQDYFEHSSYLPLILVEPGIDSFASIFGLQRHDVTLLVTWHAYVVSFILVRLKILTILPLNRFEH